MQISGEQFPQLFVFASLQKKSSSISKLLFTFQCSTLDDVLLSYITGVLEDLGCQQSVEENFDVEVFAEMLEAYIPGFAEIER